ncbi:MAG TPA: hypothetical protein VLT47_05750 [Anaeromyxobacteraceae bacterium]|nr:hypothetical protein [Anaeromyxobacteraceae bacterium]
MALLAGGCAAHLPGAGERVAFLERSTIGVSSDRTQVYEADPAAHLLLWNGLDDGAALEEGGFATTGSVSFLGAFRMLHADSAPIRTPTFEPRARLQIFRAAGLRSGGDAARPARPLLGALELSVGHRSNGQNGCALADHVRYGPADFDCAPAGAVESRRLNLVDGSFTTNYAALGISGLWPAPQPSAAGRRLALVGSTAVEWHLPCHFGACMPAPMRARYGAAVLRGSLEAVLPSLARVTFARGAADLGLRAGIAGSVHLGVSAGSPFGDASAEVALVYRPRRGLATSVFVRRHEGRDPLNIRFEERLDAWIVGLGLEPDAVALAPRPLPGAASP